MWVHYQNQLQISPVFNKIYFLENYFLFSQLARSSIVSASPSARIMISLRVLLLGVLLRCGVLCEVARDEVPSLPGFSGPLPSRQFSGYLSPVNSPSKKMHYW